MWTCKEMQNTVSSFRNYLRSLLNCYGHHTAPPSPFTSIRRRSSAKKENENHSLNTWPTEELNQTVERLAQEKTLSLNETQMLKLCSDVEEELDKLCPFKVEEEYDFCIVCCRHDMEEASSISLELQERLGISGCVVWDNVSFGRDEFIAFEEVVERSSKVIFLLTENFKNDPVCCHIAHNTFVGFHVRARNKSVPLLNKFNTEVTEELSVINKLTWDNPLHKEDSMRWIFNDGVKAEKLHRRRKNEKVKDEQRMAVLSDIFSTKVKEFDV